MTEVKYYPLVDTDTDGFEKQPMFPTEDEKTVAASHRMWLAEAVPGCFRLRTVETSSVEEAESFRIYCPRCGKTMKTISLISKASPLPLYACDDCRKTM